MTVPRLQSLAIASLLAACSATPLGGAAVSAALAGKVVSDMINEVEESGRVLLGAAQETGNTLLSKAGNEATVAAKNAALALDDVLGKRFEDLSVERRAFLASVYELRRTVEDVSGATFDLADTFSLNLMDTAARLPFSDDVDFFVQRIDGIAAVATEDDLFVRITGIGFGPDTSTRRNRIETITLQDRPLAFRVNTPRAYQSDITLIPSTRAMFIPTDRASTVPVVVRVRTQRKETFGWREKMHDLHFLMTLIPRYAGDLTIKYTIPVTEWVAIRSDTYSELTPDHRQRGDIKKYRYRYFRRLPDNQRYANPKAWGEGDGHLWSSLSSEWRPENRSTASVESGGQELVLILSVWGKAFTARFGADIQELKVVGTTSHTQTQRAAYGEVVTFRVPENAQFWEITGRTVENRGIHVVKGGTSRELELEGENFSGTERLISYRVRPPRNVSF